MIYHDQPSLSFFHSGLSEHVENKTKQRILHSCWPLNRGENNRKTIIRTSKRWPQPLNRGGHLKELLQHFSDSSFGTSVTGCLIAGGHLMDGRLIAVRLFKPIVYFQQVMTLIITKI